MVGRKLEDWRILTPIFSMVSPIVVACLAFFIVRLITDFDKKFERITLVLERQNLERSNEIKEYRDWREKTEHRLTKIERCCSVED